MTVICQLKTERKKVVPNIKSAIKRVEVAERNRERNRNWKSQIRTVTTNVEDACDSGKAEDTAAALKRAYSVIDKAVSKGILHRNTAARRKARLASQLVKSSAKK